VKHAAPPAVGLLLDVLDCAFDKRSWHGANLLTALRGVDASAAARRVRHRKCIWKQALHAAYWKHTVCNRLAGRTSFPRPGSDWPKLPARRDTSNWKADIELLRDTHRRLRTIVAALPSKGLDEKTLRLIHGAAAHDIYHAGQIKLLRKLLHYT
jgi:hypothetical protein